MKRTCIFLFITAVISVVNAILLYKQCDLFIFGVNFIKIFFLTSAIWISTIFFKKLYNISITSQGKQNKINNRYLIIAIYILSIFIIALILTLFCVNKNVHNGYMYYIESIFAFMLFLIPFSIWILFLIVKDYKKAFWCLNYCISVALSAFIYTFFVYCIELGKYDGVGMIIWTYDELSGEAKFEYFANYLPILMLSVTFGLIPPFCILNILIMHLIYSFLTLIDKKTNAI